MKKIFFFATILFSLFVWYGVADSKKTITYVVRLPSMPIDSNDPLCTFFCIWLPAILIIVTGIIAISHTDGRSWTASLWTVICYYTAVLAGAVVAMAVSRFSTEPVGIVVGMLVGALAFSWSCGAVNPFPKDEGPLRGLFFTLAGLATIGLTSGTAGLFAKQGRVIEYYCFFLPMMMLLSFATVIAIDLARIYFEKRKIFRHQH